MVFSAAIFVQPESIGAPETAAHETALRITEMISSLWGDSTALAWASTLRFGLPGVGAFDDATEFTAAVPLAGELLPVALIPSTWAEYGGRVGFKLNPQVTADLSFAGVSTLDGTDTTAQLRAAGRIAF
jgi:hypothetical protein